jgi:hypothetical protein
MNKTTKNIFIGIGVLAGLFLVGRIFQRLRKPSAEQLSSLDMNLTLSKGSTGSEVMELQRILKDELNSIELHKCIISSINSINN